MRRVVSFLVCGGLSLPVVGCSSGGDAAAVPVLVDRTAGEVRRVVVSARDGQRAELRHDGEGLWTAEPGVAPESAVVMFEAQNGLFPLLAYRRLRADPSDRQFGLVDPEITFSVHDARGRASALILGAETFNGGGFYARRPTERGVVYLVPRGVMNDLRSLAQGRPVSAPHPVDDKFERIAQRSERAGDEPDLWLRQAVEAGATEPEGLP